MWDEEFLWNCICYGDFLSQCLLKLFDLALNKKLLNLCLGLILNEHFLSVQEIPSADEAEFGEWPHVCALLKKEDIGGVRSEMIAYDSIPVFSDIDFD